MTPEDKKYWLNQGEPRADALAQIASLLSSMFISARAHVRGDDQEVVGYTVQNGALHKIVGILAGLGHRVIIPANLPTAHEHISGMLLSTKKADERGSAEPVRESNNPITALSIEMLVSAGHVSREKADEAYRLACDLMRREGWTPTAPARDGSEPMPADAGAKEVRNPPLPRDIAYAKMLADGGAPTSGVGAGAPPQSAPQDAQPDEVQCLRCGFVNYVQDGESPAKTQHRMQMKRTEHLRLGAAPQASQSAPGEAWVLPFDVTIGNGTFRTGVHLSNLVNAAQRWHRMAYPQHYTLTDEEKAANLKRLQDCSTHSAPVAGMTDDILDRACASLAAFVSDEGWQQSDMDTLDALCAAREAALREKDGGKA